MFAERSRFVGMNIVTKETSFDNIMPLITESFRQGLSVTIPITGRSMRPLFLHKRDRAVLAKCEPLCLRRGDVPLYQRPGGQYVLHRIVRVEKECYVFAGDAQRKTERLPKTCVLAVMTGFVRKGRSVTCNAVTYRLYVWWWMLLRPLRPLIFRLARVAKRILQKNA